MFTRGFCKIGIKSRNTEPGEEVIAAIVTETNDKQFALFCLKKIIPSFSPKITVAHESLWGYDKKTIKVKM